MKPTRRGRDRLRVSVLWLAEGVWPSGVLHRSRRDEEQERDDADDEEDSQDRASDPERHQDDQADHHGANDS